MYEIIISDKALKQIGKLEKPIRERIFNALERIRIRPDAYVTKLVGDAAYKLRAGDYRVLMDIDKNRLKILVIMVGRRRNVFGGL